MIGFDRPLRPQWIHDTLMLAQPGQKLSDLNRPFEGIAKELTGKEGKRKVRTVLFRCFLRDEEKKTKVQDSLVLKDLGEKYGLEFMVPVYLFYLVGKTETLIKISEHIFRLYDFGSPIKLSFLKEKMVDAFGERDVVTRATGAFIKTLHYFGIAEINENEVLLKKKLILSEEQVCVVLKMFAWEIIKSPQISLNHLPTTIFNYFKTPDLKTLAQKHNGTQWDYQHRMKEDLIVIHANK